MREDHLQNSDESQVGSGSEPSLTDVARDVPKITTKTGDDGTTGLLFGGRVRKDDPVIEAVGALDEAQAAIGMARAYSRHGAHGRPSGNMPVDHQDAPEDSTDLLLESIERDLWILMAEVSGFHKGDKKLIPGKTRVTSEMVDFLGETGEHLSMKLEMPKGFAVPGESIDGSLLDNARVIVRRAERRIVALPMSEASYAGRYLNRLSDLLWIMARLADGKPRMVRDTE